MAAALITFTHGIPLAAIGIPASLVPLYVWVRFARNQKGRW